MLIDTHCHINCLPCEFVPKLDDPCGISEIKVSRISAQNYIFIDSSIDGSSSQSSLRLSEKFPYIYSALGFHPFSAKSFAPGTIDFYTKLIKENRKVIAVGEIGLDEKTDVPLKQQEEIFCHFLNLAREFNLTVIIHNRLSNYLIFDVIDRYFGSYEKIIFHCFSYGRDFLQRIIDKGGYASFSLSILRKKREVLESLKLCPLNNILLETDSPYIKIDNRPSSPLDIETVYLSAAAEKNINKQELENAVYQNANRLFVF
jgi:TatD DNase family protein